MFSNASEGSEIINILSRLLISLTALQEGGALARLEPVASDTGNLVEGAAWRNEQIVQKAK